MERQARIFKNLSGNTLAITILFLIFLAIGAYGGEFVWHEALIVGAVFVVSAVTFIAGSVHEVLRLPLRLFLPLLFLSAYSFLQGVTPLVFAGPEYAGLVPYGLDATASLWNGVKIAGMVCLLALCIMAVRLSRELFVHGLILIGSLFAVFGIGRFLIQIPVPAVNHYFFAYELGPGIGFGPFLNQNHFALLMLMTLGLSLGPLLAGRILEIKKVPYLIASLIAWIALVLTASRAGITASFFVIGAAIVFHIAAAMSRDRKGGSRDSKFFFIKAFAGSILIFGALVAGVLIVGQDRVLHRFAQLPDQIEGSSGLAFRRADVWEATLKLIQEHYVFGVGFGGFRYAVSQFIDIAGDIVPRQAHNDFLEFVASGGLIAMALGIWFVWMLFLEMSRSRRKSPGGKLSAAAVGAICGIVGVTLHSLADFGLQYLGNLSFLIALLSVAISPADTLREMDRHETQPIRNTIHKAAAIVLVIAFCFACASIGVSRYLLSGRVDDVQTQPAINIPFDAEYYSVTAERLVREGDKSSAAAALRDATRLRAYDHELWLRLAILEAETGNSDAAADAFRSSITLAPLYGGPHFYYGAFLLNSPKTVEAINELVFAARRDRRLTDAVLEMIWGRTTHTLEYLQYLTTDGHYQTNASVTHFLLDKREYELIRELSCRVEFSEMERDMIVRQLLERHSVRTAWQIHRRQCEKADGPSSFIDGDFELSEVKKGPGFGWLLGEALKRPNVGFDRANAASGKQSLKFIFDGEVPSAFLQQTIPVRENTQYVVSFLYKSRAIVSGEMPIVQILLKRSGDVWQVAETELSPDTGQWEQKTLSFETGDNTEAIEVVLSKRPCGDSKCPIFGELWVDDFVIVESGK